MYGDQMYGYFTEFPISHFEDAKSRHLHLIIFTDHLDLDYDIPSTMSTS